MINTRSTQDLLQGLHLADDANAVLDKMQVLLKPLGVEFLCLNFLPRAGEHFQHAILASHIPRPWLDLYLRMNYATVDPAIRHCRYVVEPFEYLSAPYHAEKERRASEVVQRASDFGLTQGLLVPIPGRAGNIGNVWMGCFAMSEVRTHLAFAHLIGLYGFQRLQKLYGPKTQSTPKLSVRELDVLTWAAAGRSSWETGERLNISSRTVEWHLCRAVEKLGAKNRTQAVAIALRDGLISI